MFLVCDTYPVLGDDTDTDQGQYYQNPGMQDGFRHTCVHCSVAVFRSTSMNSLLSLQGHITWNDNLALFQGRLDNSSLMFKQGQTVHRNGV